MRAIAGAALALSTGLLACGGQGASARDGGEHDGTVDGRDDTGGGTGTPSDAAPEAQGPPCICPLDGAVPECVSQNIGVQCTEPICGSSMTTLTGKVFDPAGLNPLYGVIVFVPDNASALPAITPGTNTCATCDTPIGSYVAAAVTDYTGTFTLNGVPTGVSVPVTVQIGKWRRTVNVSVTTRCGANSVPDGTLRLPRNHTEGDMPRMALLTGGCDDLGCFLTNMGIDPQEFTAPQAGGNVDVYQGLGGDAGTGAGLSSGAAGDCTTSACPLWASKESLEYYDAVMLSCECGENNQTKPPAAMQALHDWLAEGGRVFASHFQYTWFKNNPEADFQDAATWLGPSAATGSGTYGIDTSFPKGEGFAQWLGVVGALESDASPPAIDLTNVATSVSSVNEQSTNRWIYDPATTPNDTKYLSFETPIGGATPPSSPCNQTAPAYYCGKAVFADLDTSGSPPGAVQSIPSGCPTQALTPQQKALEFLFFDMGACVSGTSPPPPPVPPPPCDAGEADDAGDAGSD
ncbi:MAG: hypothetical protein ACLP1X_00335 [Polyangiaceae bacterium]